MNTQKQIEELEAKLRALKQSQSNCKHDFCEPYQDTEIIKTPLYKNEFRGSDIFPVFTGFRESTEMVWRRECKLCGLVQTTKKTEPVIINHKPKFE